MFDFGVGFQTVASCADGAGCGGRGPEQSSLLVVRTGDKRMITGSRSTLFFDNFAAYIDHGIFLVIRYVR